MKLRFWKMSGAGNDFILIEKEALRDKARLSPRLVSRLCHRRLGIGADGVLALSRGQQRGRPRLAYFNADGSQAFCGNGARCAAWWMSLAGWTGSRRFSFDSDEGPLEARIAGPELVSIHMPQPRQARLGLGLRALGKNLAVHAINTGAPHAVVPVGRAALETLDVHGLGQALRHHPAFKPGGANVNFAAFIPEGLLLRTYERGVEAETLACGTGATAAALVGFLLGRCRPPVEVGVRSGDRLRVCFTPLGGKEFGEVWLEGPARVVYTGELEPRRSLL